MELLGVVTKQPREILDFDIDYATVLANRVDTLTTITTEITPATPLTVVSATVFGSRVKVTISNGTNAITYKITILADTASGLKYEDEVSVLVEEV